MKINLYTKQNLFFSLTSTALMGIALLFLMGFSVEQSSNFYQKVCQQLQQTIAKELKINGADHPFVRTTLASMTNPTCSGGDLSSIYIMALSPTFQSNIYQVSDLSTTPTITSVIADVASGGLTLSGPVHASAPDPAFYVSNFSDGWKYYDGTAFVDAGHTVGGVNSGGGTTYNFTVDPSGGDIYRYDGTGNETLLTNITGGGEAIRSADIAVDKNDNFYVFLEDSGNLILRKYDSAGTQQEEFSTSNLPAIGGSTQIPGMAIIGNDIYAVVATFVSGGTNTNFLYHGVQSSSDFAFTQIADLTTIDADVDLVTDLAACPTAGEELTPSIGVAPGGVPTNLALWLKADAGITETGTVSDWLNQAPSGLSVSQPTAGDQPTYLNDGINFNPGLEFSGSQVLYNGFMNPTVIPNVSDPLTFAYVVSRTTNGGTSTIVEMHDNDGGSGDNPAIEVNSLNAGIKTGTNEYNTTRPLIENEPTLVTGYWSNNNSSPIITQYINGGHQEDNTNNNQNDIGLSEILIGANNQNGGGDALNGILSEVILYNTDQRTGLQQIESYLGIKYGISLLHDYVTSDGTTIWTSGGGYDNNIAGIGQDDDATLLQKQSKSVSNGVVGIYHGDHSGGLPVTNAANSTAFSANKDFLLWGQNGNAATYSTDYVPNSFTPADGYKIMGRIWTVQETGTVGIVTVHAPNDAEHLIVHNSADFSTGTPNEIALTDDGNGNMVATIDLANGEFFTFGKESSIQVYGVRDQTDFGYFDDTWNWVSVGTVSANTDGFGIVNSTTGIAVNDNFNGSDPRDRFVLINFANGVETALTPTNGVSFVNSDYETAVYDSNNNIFYVKEEGENRIHKFSVNVGATSITYDGEIAISGENNTDDWTIFDNKLYGVDGGLVEIDPETGVGTKVNISDLTNGGNIGGEIPGIWTLETGEVQFMQDDGDIYQLDLSNPATPTATQIATANPNNIWNNNNDDFGGFGGVFCGKATVSTYDCGSSSTILVDLVAAVSGYNAGGTWTDLDGSGVSLATPNAVDFSAIAYGNYQFNYADPNGTKCDIVTVAHQVPQGTYGIRADTDFGYLTESGGVFTYTSLSTLSETSDALALLNECTGVAVQQNLDQFFLVDLLSGTETLLTTTNPLTIPNDLGYDVGTYDKTNGIYYITEENQSRIHSYSINTVTNEITYLQEWTVGSSINSDDWTFYDGKIYAVDGNNLEVFDPSDGSYSETNLPVSHSEVSGMWTNDDGTIYLIADNAVYEVATDASAYTLVGSLVPNSGWTNEGDDFAGPGGTGCPAGNTAPPLSASTLSNTCPTATADLDALHTGSVPVGATLVWSTDNDSSDGLTSLEASPTSNSGTYYAYYYDSTENCYSPVSSAVTVTIAPCCTDVSTATCPTTTSLDLTSYVNAYAAGGTWVDVNSSGANLADPTAVDMSAIATGTYVFRYNDISGTKCDNVVVQHQNTVAAPVANDVTSCEGETVLSVEIPVANQVDLQTPYEEDFSGNKVYAIRGACTGTSPNTCNVDGTSDPAFANINFEGDYSGFLHKKRNRIRRRSGELRVRNTGGNEICITSTIVNLNPEDMATVIVDTRRKSGNMDVDDYIKINYILDGVSTTISNRVGKIGNNFQTTRLGGLQGSTLQIEICIKSNHKKERHAIGYMAIEVEKAPTVPPVYKWYSDAGLTTQVATGETYDPMTTPGNTETYYVTCTMNGCESAAQDVVVSVSANPGEPMDAADIYYCPGGNGTVDFTTAIHPYQAGGTWADDDATGINLSDPTAVDISGLANGEYDFTYTLAGVAPCAGEEVTLSVYIGETPEAPAIEDLTTCEGETSLVIPYVAEDAIGLQVAYLEDFSGSKTYAVRGACSGAAASTCDTDGTGDAEFSNIIISGDFSGFAHKKRNWIRQKGGELRIRNTGDNEICFTSTVVNLNANEVARIKARTRRKSGSMENDDYIKVNYILDGVTTEVTNRTGQIGKSFQLTQMGGLTGSTIQVQVCVNSDHKKERYAIDDLSIEIEQLPPTPPLYQWYSDVGLTNLVATGESYDPMTAPGATETYYVTCAANGCTSPAQDVVVSVSANTVTPMDDEEINVAPGSSTPVDLVAAINGYQSGGVWADDDATGLNITDPTSVDVSSLAAGEYDFTYTVNGTAPCSGEEVTVTVFVDAAICSDPNLYADNCDFDSDGVDNVDDLDDDNDGILDTEEGSCNTTNSGSILWNNANTFSTQDAATTYIASGVDPAIFGSGLTGVANGGFYFDVSGVNTTTFAAAKTDNDYAELSFTTAANFPNRFYGWRMAVGLSPNTAHRGGYSYAVEISTDNFTTSTALLQDVFVDDLQSGDTYVNVGTGIDYDFSPSTTYTIRVYLYDDIASTDSPVDGSDAIGLISFDDFYLLVRECVSLDTDNDNIANHFDLDSDGDGCSDAFEAGATTDQTVDFQFSDVVSGDANGISPSVDPNDNGSLNYTPTYVQATDGTSACSAPFTPCTTIHYSAPMDIQPLTSDADSPNGIPNECTNVGYVDNLSSPNTAAQAEVAHVAVNCDGKIGTAGDWGRNLQFSSPPWQVAVHGGFNGVAGNNVFFHNDDFTPIAAHLPTETELVAARDNSYIVALHNGDFMVVNNTGNNTSDMFRVADDGTATPFATQVPGYVQDALVSELGEYAYLSTRTNGGIHIRKVSTAPGDAGADVAGYSAVYPATGATHGRDIDEQPDGKLLVASTAGLRRLNADGTEDTSFPFYAAELYGVKLQSDGKIVISGQFTDSGYENIARLNADGTLDTSFHPVGITSGTNSINELEINAFDEIYAYGNVPRYDGVAGTIAKLNPDGTVNMEWMSNFYAGSTDFITDYEIQADGKVLITGWFPHLKNVFQRGLIRVHRNGIMDTEINNTPENIAHNLGLTESDPIVTGIATQPNKPTIASTGLAVGTRLTGNSGFTAGTAVGIYDLADAANFNQIGYEPNAQATNHDFGFTDIEYDQSTGRYYAMNSCNVPTTCGDPGVFAYNPDGTLRWSANNASQGLVGQGRLSPDGTRFLHTGNNGSTNSAWLLDDTDGSTIITYGVAGQGFDFHPTEPKVYYGLYQPNSSTNNPINNIQRMDYDGSNVETINLDEPSLVDGGRIALEMISPTDFYLHFAGNPTRTSHLSMYQLVTSSTDFTPNPTGNYAVRHPLFNNGNEIEFPVEFRIGGDYSNFTVGDDGTAYITGGNASANQCNSGDYNIISVSPKGEVDMDFIEVIVQPHGTISATVAIDFGGAGCDFNDGTADCDGDGQPNATDPIAYFANTNPDTLAADAGSPAVINILANDDFLPNNDPANIGTTTITDAGTGTATGTIAFDAATGELTYTPTLAEKLTSVTVDYTVCNTNPTPSVCKTETVMITVGCENGTVSSEIFVTAATGNGHGSLGTNNGVIGEPDGGDTAAKRIAVGNNNTPVVLTYGETFSGGSILTLYGNYYTSNYEGDFTIAFSEDNSTWTAETANQNIGSLSYTTLTYVLPTTMTGNYQYIRLTPTQTPEATLTFIDAAQVTKRQCAMYQSYAYDDSGAGAGGVFGDCMENGDESSMNLPAGIFANVIQGGAVVQSAAFDANGFYQILELADGTYDVIFTISETSTTAATPNLYEFSSGTGSYSITVASGAVTSPTMIPTFCIKGCEYGIVTESQYASGNTGGLTGAGNGAGAPDGQGVAVFANSTATNRASVFTYDNTLTGGNELIITARYIDTRQDGILVAFSTDGTTYTTNSPLINGWSSTTVYENVSYTIPASFTDNYTHIRVQGNSNNSYLNIDAIEVKNQFCVTCPTGLDAPNLSANTATNNCPTQTIDLTTITADNTPANSALTWHTATPATNVNKIADPTMVAAGTYYAAFYHAGDDCYSGIDGAGTSQVTADGDSDCDGVLDGQDIDDDNDGVLDADEILCSNAPIISTNPWEINVYNTTQTAYESPLPCADNFGLNNNPNTELVANGTMGEFPNELKIEWYNSQGSIGNTTPDPGGGPFLLSVLNANGGNVTALPSSPAIRVPYIVEHITEFNSGNAGYYDIVTDNATTDDGFLAIKVDAAGNETVLVCNEIFSQQPLNVTNELFEVGDKLKLIINEYGSISQGLNITLGQAANPPNGTQEYCVALDTDNDDIPNHLDLDSDGDGCSDAYEAGATTDLTADYQFPTTNVGANGLDDSLEGSPEDGMINYTSTYAQATDDQVNACPQPCTDPNLYGATCDFDGDGVENQDDLDDDNDGILDTDEGLTPFNLTNDNDDNFCNGNSAALSTMSGNIVSSSNPLYAFRETNQTQGANYTITLTEPVFINGLYFDSFLNSSTDPNNAAVYGNFTVVYSDNTTQSDIDFTVNPVRNAYGFLSNLSVDYGLVKVLSLSTNPALDGKKGVRVTDLSDTTNDDDQGSGTIDFTDLDTSKPIKSITFTLLQQRSMPFTLTGHVGVRITCASDSDNDGVSNHFDLDSDGDGCSDAFEAGVISTESSDINVAPFDGTNVGLNGFEDSVETGSESGIYDGTYTYAQATDDQVNACPQPCTDPNLYGDNCDFDGDGVNNEDDLDDDNDGVLDTEEFSCDVLNNSEVFSSLTVQNIPQTPSTVNNNNTSGSSVTLNYGQGTGSLVNSIIFASGNTLELNPNIQSGQVFIRRNLSSGNADRSNIWMERESTSGSTTNISVNEPVSLEEVLSRGQINIGSDNIFQNGSSAGTVSNIERVDVVFQQGILTIDAAKDFFLFAERGLNNSYIVAAITGIDGTGTPTSYSTPSAITSGEHFSSGPSSDFDIFIKNPSDADFRQSNNFNQAVGIAYRSFDQLGIADGTTVYGFSILPNDYNTGNILDWNTYPTNTSGAVGGVDLSVITNQYSSCSALDTDNDGIANHLDLDSDGDGCPDAVEAGVMPTTNLMSGDVVNGDGTTNTTTATDDAAFVFTSPTNDANMDGLHDDVDSNQDGATDYTSTYAANALDDQVNACPQPCTDPNLYGATCDFDGDGVENQDDLDDDNDGILDLEENGLPCYENAQYLDITQGNIVRAGLVNGTTYPSVTSAAATPSGSLTYNATLSQWVSNNGTDNTDTALSNGIAVGDPTLQDILHGQNDNSVEPSNNFTWEAEFTNINAYEDQLFILVAFLANSQPFTFIAYDESNNVIDLTGVPVLGTFRDSRGGTPTWTPSTTQGQISTPGGGGSGRGVAVDLSNLGVKRISIQYTTDTDNDGWGMNLASVCIRDTDNDGITNEFDLDSDGDGCSDAFEAGATTDQTADFQFPTTNVGANGLDDSLEGSPEDGVINYSSTYANALDNSVKNCYPDTDMDGIVDIDDLDDDNDGILDTDEGCGITSDYANNSSINVLNTTSSVTHTLSANPAIDVTYNITTANSQIFTHNPASGNDQGPLLFWFSSASNNPSDLQATLDVEMVFTQTLYNATFKVTDGDTGEGLTAIIKDASGNTYDLTNGGLVTRGSQWSQVGNSFTATTTGNDGQQTSDDALGALIFTIPEVSSIQFLANSNNPPNNYMGLFFTEVSFCTGLDTDNDGVADLFDLDSDNDGIYDADEAGHSAVHTNGQVDGAVGANGLADALETTVDNGMLTYTLADSEATPDGTPDFLETDADGDTCNDTDEAGVSDTDMDGIAGTGTPTVDANGLVMSITYATPANTEWQDPAVMSACNTAPEITNYNSDPTASINYAENGTGDVIDWDATDADGETENGGGLSYALTGADAALFTLDPATGILTWNASPDFENPQDTDMNNAYEVIVTVTDAASTTDEQALTINVTDDTADNAIRLLCVDPSTDMVSIKNFGTVAQDISNFRLCSKFSYTNNGIATDMTVTTGTLVLAPGATVELTGFSLDATGADLSLFLPNGAFSSAAAMLDFTQWKTAGNGRESVAVSKGIWTAGDFIAAEPQYCYTGNGTTEYGLPFWDAQNPPEITNLGGVAAMVDLPENQTVVQDINSTDPDGELEGTGNGDQLDYSLSGTDASFFSIDDDGNLAFVSAPSYEDPQDSGMDNVYEVIVTVTDSGGLTDTQAWTITITDVDEDGDGYINGAEPDDDDPCNPDPSEAACQQDCDANAPIIIKN